MKHYYLNVLTKKQVYKMCQNLPTSLEENSGVVYVMICTEFRDNLVNSLARKILIKPNDLVASRIVFSTYRSRIFSFKVCYPR